MMHVRRILDRGQELRPTFATMRASIIVLATIFLRGLCAQTPCVNGFAGGFPCSGIDLLAQMSVAQLGSTTSVADVWGWTDPLTGKEYAVVGTRTGTAFVDLSVPTAPVRVGFLPTHLGTGSLWRDVDVAGNWCFVGSEISGHGLQVFDLTRLRAVTDPPVTFTEDAWYGGFGNSHTICADRQHPYVYAVGTNTASGGLHAVNVTNPLAPVIAGTYSIDGYIHENTVVTYAGPDTGYTGKQISFNFHTGTPDRITIVDVTDKTDMTRISTVTYGGGYLCHQGWLTEDHRFLLMDDEGDEANLGHPTRTRIFNIEDLDTAVYVGAFDGPNASSDHNLYLHKGLVWESNYTSGLQVLDTVGLSSGSLSMSAWFDTYPANNGSSYNGAWGNYPFFSSGIVLVTGINEGLFILRPRLNLSVRVLLEGPYDPGIGLMGDALRAQGLLPLTEPYSGMGYTHIGGGGESTSAQVLSLTGPDAIVDWVVLELRDSASPAIVRATRSALLQRDGDVVDTDGVSPVWFASPVSNYHIAVRHRNHLGAMTADPLPVSVALRNYDLSEQGMSLFGGEPTRLVGGRKALWMGNALGDQLLKYTGSANDRDPILVRVGSTAPNQTVAGYWPEDTNMDGVVKYTGSGNDRDPVLVNIGGTAPNNTRMEELP
jgi:choice-of-anchor B domain-containing protein